MNDVVGIGAQVAATVVAVVALIISFIAERRNQKRFNVQMDESRRIAHGSVRPLLAVTISGYLGRKAMHLANHGIGAAVVTHITFQRGERTAASVPDLIDFSRNVVWNDFTEYAGDGTFYIPPGESETLIELTLEHLLRQGVNECEAAEMMNSLESQLEEITVVVTYEDVLGDVLAEEERIN